MSEEITMKCNKCGKQYDTTSWQALRLCSVGATGSGNVATSIVENRICTCGGSVSVQKPLPPGTSKAHADLLVAAALLSESDNQS